MNYASNRLESPGLGVVLSADQKRTDYRWIPFAQPIAKHDIDRNLDPDDATKMGNIRFESYWLFEISQQSFSKVVGNRSTAWGNLKRDSR